MKIKEAAEQCKVRGYIARKKLPHVKIWKNRRFFEIEVSDISLYDQHSDWDCFDPEGEEASIVG